MHFLNYNLTIREFSKEETNILKGIAIISIALHNVLLHIIPKVGQNEFWFSEDTIKRFWFTITLFPLEAINAFFDFLGHYGVQAFIVLSAYGLTKSFQNHNIRNYFSFLGQRFYKIYPSFLLAAIFFLILLMLRNQFLDKETLKDLLIQLSLTANFFPDKAMAISGPWWFYSFIFQFYIVFPLLYRLLIRFGIKSMIFLGILGIILFYFIYEPLRKINLNYFHFFIGHLPELCVGIIFAHKKILKIPVWVMLLTLVLFVVGNLNYYFWPFANVSAAILFLISTKFIFTLKQKINIIYLYLAKVGMISMFVFATHGLIRKGFINLANDINLPHYTLTIAGGYLLVSLIFGYLFYKIDWLVRIKFVKNKTMLIPAYAFVLFILLSVFNQKMEQNKNQQMSQPIGIIINDFEKDSTNRNIISDSLAFSGDRFIRLNNETPFSPPIVYNFENDKIWKLSCFQVNSMVFTTDSTAQFFFVVEIFHKKSQKTLFYHAENIKTNSMKVNQWSNASYVFALPNMFKSDKFGIKTYVWLNSNYELLFDDFKLTFY